MCIRDSLPAPDITLKHSRGGTADLSWSFHHDLQQNIKLGYIQGKFGESGQWQTIVPAGANGTLAFEGETQITVPDTEGSQDLFIRGISKDGTEGTQNKVTCTVDKTAPVAVLKEMCIRDRIQVHTVSCEYEFYGKLDEILQRIPPGFIRIHKSFLVNELYVKRWGYEAVTMTDGTEMSISMRYRKAVRESLLKRR